MTKSLEGLIDHAQDWATRAEAFILRNGMSVTDENRQYLIQMTAIYLLHVDQLGIMQTRRDCYVVHSQDKDWRYQTSDRADAYARFKKYVATERVGMFYWDGKGNCDRLHASENYTLTRDY